MSTEPVITVRVARRFDATPERVFDAWLDPALARRFLFATDGGQMLSFTIDARVGGGYRIVERRAQGEAEHWGSYLEIVRPHRLVFTLAVEEGVEGDRISIDFTRDGDGCRIDLVHEMRAEYAEYVDRTAHGWNHICSSLANVLSMA